MLRGLGSFVSVYKRHMLVHCFFKIGMLRVGDSLHFELSHFRKQPRWLLLLLVLIMVFFGSYLPV